MIPETPPSHQYSVDELYDRVGHESHLKRKADKMCRGRVSHTPPGLRKASRDLHAVMGVSTSHQCGLPELKSSLPGLYNAVDEAVDQLMCVRARLDILSQAFDQCGSASKNRPDTPSIYSSSGSDVVDLGLKPLLRRSDTSALPFVNEPIVAPSDEEDDDVVATRRYRRRRT